MRTDDVHLWVEVTLVHDAVVVEVILCLQKTNQNSKLTALFLAIFVQFLQEVIVLVLGGSSVHLVLHLEHDRDILSTIL